MAKLIRLSFVMIAWNPIFAQGVLSEIQWVMKSMEYARDLGARSNADDVVAAEGDRLLLELDALVSHDQTWIRAYLEDEAKNKLTAWQKLNRRQSDVVLLRRLVVGGVVGKK